MSTIHQAPPPTIGDHESPDVEVLFAEARARARRRRIRTLVVVVILLALVAGAGITYHALLPVRHHVAAVPPRTATGTTPFPSTFVGYDVDDKTNVGGIKVFSSTTGRAIRTLVAIHTRPDFTDQFSNLGFDTRNFQLADDGSTVYFAETISNTAPLRIVSVPVAGGSLHALVNGMAPEVSTDNTLLAYTPAADHATYSTERLPDSIGILDLKTGSKRVITIPGMRDDQDAQYAWLPGSTELFIATTDVETGPEEVSPNQAIIKNPALTSRTQLYNTVTGRFSTLAASTTAALEQTATTRVTVTGPALQAGTVRVTGKVKTPGSQVPHEAVGTLDVQTGTLVWQHSIPAGDYLASPAALAGQSSGQHFLLGGPNGDQVFTWTPSTGKEPTPITTVLNTTGINPIA